MNLNKKKQRSSLKVAHREDYMTKIEAIDKEINQLKAQLNQVEGTPTEVYARIVGYYRSVKNWNKGKKSEFAIRKEFSNEFCFPQLKQLPQDSCEQQKSSSDSDIKDGFLYFYRESCPNCPPVKNYLNSISAKLVLVNVDTKEGLKSASKYDVMATPTAIYFDNNGKELFRGSCVADLKKAFEVAC